MVRVREECICELEKRGFENLNNCYFKEIGKGYVIRVDKKTRLVKCCHYFTGRQKSEKRIKELKGLTEE